MLDTRDDIEAPAGQRQAGVRLIQRLREVGEPVVLTINGSLNLVVQDATSLQQLIEIVDRVETLEALRESLKDEAEGRLLSLDEVKERVRSQHGLSV